MDPHPEVARRLKRLFAGKTAPGSIRLNPDQLLDLLEGLAYRQHWNATYGVTTPPVTESLEAELDLALRWFRNWWKDRADSAALRSHRARPADDNQLFPLTPAAKDHA